MNYETNIQYEQSKNVGFPKKIFIIIGIIIIVSAGVIWFIKSRDNEVFISLENIPENITISKNTKELKLRRGDYTYTLIRKDGLESNKYLVSLTDTFGKWITDRNDPIDTYSASYELLPYDEKHKKALELSKTLNESGRFDIPIGSQEEGQELMELMNNLEKEKINVAILPADPLIREKSKNVKINDIITVSGIYFDHSKVEKNGMEQKMSQCLQNVDLFYVTYLNVSQ